MLMIVPAIVVYLFAEKYIVTGLMGGELSVDFSARIDKVKSHGY